MKRKLFLVIWAVVFLSLSFLSVRLQGLIWLVWLAWVIAGIFCMVQRAERGRLEKLAVLLEGELSDALVLRCVKQLTCMRFVGGNQPVRCRLAAAGARVSASDAVTAETKQLFENVLQMKGLC